MRKDVLHETALGSFVTADSLELLPDVESSSAKLALFSPPFELDGFRDKEEYLDKLLTVFSELDRILVPDGHIVFELGSFWVNDRPVRGTHMFTVLHELFSRNKWQLQQDFFWYNPQLLNTPGSFLQEKLRKRSSVTNLFWLSKGEAGVDISALDSTEKALPNESVDDLLSFKDGALDHQYRERCKRLGSQPFPDRFPVTLARAFIEMLTRPGDRVIDPFAGCGTTGAAAELSGRRWLCIELERKNAAMVKAWFE